MAFLSRWPLNRQISQWLTPGLAWMGLTPNQVTTLSLAAGLAGAWNFSLGTASAALIGALLFEASYLLDNCDGELARMTGQSSGFGSWFDLVTDCLIHMGFFLGLAVGLGRIHPNPFWIKLGFMTAGGVFLTYVTFLIEQVRFMGQEALRHPDPPREEPASMAEKLRKIFREDFSLLVFGSVLMGRTVWLLWAGMIGAHFYWIWTVGNLLKKGDASS